MLIILMKTLWKWAPLIPYLILNLGTFKQKFKGSRSAIDLAFANAKAEEDDGDADDDDDADKADDDDDFWSQNGLSHDGYGPPATLKQEPQ